MNKLQISITDCHNTIENNIKAFIQHKDKMINIDKVSKSIVNYRINIMKLIYKIKG